MQTHFTPGRRGQRLLPANLTFAVGSMHSVSQIASPFPIPFGSRPVASGVITLSSYGNLFRVSRRIRLGECRFRSSNQISIGSGWAFLLLALVSAALATQFFWRLPLFSMAQFQGWGFALARLPVRARLGGGFGYLGRHLCSGI